MVLDPATLTVVACIMSAVIGALLAFSWLHDRRSDALGLWSICALMAAMGSFLYMFDGIRSDAIGRQVGNALFALAFSLSFGAARRFNDKPIPWLLVAASPAAWFAANLTLDMNFYDRLVMMSLLVGGFGLATARELWIGSGRDTPSQRAGAIVTAANALYFLARPLGGPGTTVMKGMVEPAPGWMAVVGIVIILYGMIFGFLIMAMTKEKSDLQHRRAALVDPLTGIANRRAFMAEAESLLEAARRGVRPAALIMFDLDHFKAINDSHGHLVGDHTLVEFSAIVRTRLPQRASFGRLGGEEFAVCLEGLDRPGAVALAEGIRADIARLAEVVMGCPVAATVSAGVAAHDRGGSTLQELMAAADKALYCAKAEGRNRVVCDARRAETTPRRAKGALTAVQG